jgi:photosystem II reaction center protein PsbP
LQGFLSVKKQPYQKIVFLPLIVSFTIFFTTISTSGVAEAQSTSELVTYADTTKGFTLQYPSGWSKEDGNAQNFSFVLHSPDDSGTLSVTILRPGPADLAGITSNMTLDVLVKSIALPAGALSLPPNELSALGVNIIELNSEGYFLSGHPAGRIVMTVSGGSSNVKIMALATIVNDGLYALSYMADTTTYNQYLADAQTIIDSFEIISNK